MNADDLLAKYERVAEAPNAIDDLRAFVLALAFRGKLVSQQPDEISGSVLLKKTLETRESLEKSRVIKKASLPYGPLPCGLAEQLPLGWARSTLGAVCDLQTGATPDTGRKDFFGGAVRWLVSGDINRGDIFECDGRITELALGASNCKLLPIDSVLIALNGQGKTRGMVALLKIPAACNQSLVAIIPLRPDCLSPEYLRLNLKSRYRAIRTLTGGDERRGLNMRLISCFEISIPPLAEQHRIVAKVNELMALCDRLEAARAQRETTRDRLTAATLARLNTPEPATSPDDDAPKASSFQSDARFALSILPAITTRPDQVKQLQQTILNLAVRGSLLPQSTDDQPAASLLKDIAVAREALVARKELKRSKQLPNVGPEEIEHEVPQGWILCRLGDAYDVRDGTHDTPKYVDSGVPLVTSKNLYAGFLSLSDVKLISEQDHAKISERSRVDKDDILFAMIGSIGNPVIVDTDQPFSIKNVALFKYFDRAHSCPAFLKIFLSNASHKMKILATGGLQPFVSLGFLRAYPMGLPPLAEQHRIVAKVDELLSLCDQLEASLTRGENARSRLLNALLHEALAPGEPALEAA